MTAPLLSDEERERFAGWCENEARSLADNAEQMGKIGIPESMVRHFRMRATAYALVAKELRNTESTHI